MTVLIILLSLITAHADVEPPQTVMNGFTLKQFGNFSKNWNLVTVRFREDTKELRFTYANDIAFAALKSEKGKYPDGAIFAKIGLQSQKDEAFPNSLAPSGARRYQFMVRDAKKFQDTGGWGYALYDSMGNVFRDNVATQSKACAACHNIVASRQYVFSQLASLEPQPEKVAKDFHAAVAPIKFKTVAVKDLPELRRRKIPKEFASVRVLEGQLADDYFLGTGDEIRVVLMNEVTRSHLPAMVITKMNGHFLAMYPQKDGTGCANTQPSKKMLSFDMVVVHNYCVAESDAK